MRIERLFLCLAFAATFICGVLLFVKPRPRVTVPVASLAPYPSLRLRIVNLHAPDDSLLRIVVDTVAWVRP